MKALEICLDILKEARITFSDEKYRSLIECVMFNACLGMEFQICCYGALKYEKYWMPPIHLRVDVDLLKSLYQSGINPVNWMMTAGLPETGAKAYTRYQCYSIDNEDFLIMHIIKWGSPSFDFGITFIDVGEFSVWRVRTECSENLTQKNLSWIPPSSNTFIEM